jgi:hypothetical protein
VSGTSGTPNWRLGANHSAELWQRKMQRRGCTADQIEEAVRLGQRFAAANNIQPANGATRYVHPTTGRSVVLDDATDEVIHVGGDGFVY